MKYILHLDTKMKTLFFLVIYPVDFSLKFELIFDVQEQ